MQDDIVTTPAQSDQPSTGSGQTHTPNNQTETRTDTSSATSPVTPGATAEPSTTSPSLPAYQPVEDARIPTLLQTPFRPGSMEPGQKRLKKPFVIAGGAAAAVLLLAAALVFGLYLPNTPEAIYSDGLKNTGLALERLIDYSKTQHPANDKNAKLDGLLTVKSPSGSYDFDLTAVADRDGNAAATVNADVLGEKVSVNTRIIHVKTTTSPDVYLQATGFKSLLDSLGVSQYDALDGQWIAIDHTLLDTYAQTLKKAESGSKVKQPGQAVTAPTMKQVIDAETKVQTVNKQYLFTTDANKAVLTNEKYIGATKQNGRDQRRYIVGYNKPHLQAYITAVGQALDASQLNDWAVATGGKSLSKLMDLQSFHDSLKNAKSDYTFNMWVDTGTRLVSRLEFVDPSDSTTTFALSQNYTGGNTYPLTLAFNSKDDIGNPQSGSLKLMTDVVTRKVQLNITADAKDDSGETTVQGALTLALSSDAVNVKVPTGAKSLVEVLNSLGLTDLMSEAPFMPSAT